VLSVFSPIVGGTGGFDVHSSCIKLEYIERVVVTIDLSLLWQVVVLLEV